MILKTIKKIIFLRKLNKVIREYGAKATIKDDFLIIKMRGSQSSVPLKDLKNKEIIPLIIKEIRIRNIKEATETGIPRKGGKK